MLNLEIIEALSLPGDWRKPNEDCWSAGKELAFVIDGATGVADRELMPHAGTDARWLARFCRDRLVQADGDSRPMADVVRQVLREAREAYFARAGGEPPSTLWPTAGFQLLRVINQALETAWLADCRLVISDSTGRVRVAGGTVHSIGQERERARQMISAAGGLPFRPDGTVFAAALEGLRATRLDRNQPGGLWTLGLEPAAADHLGIEVLDIQTPATALLATDGFYALSSHYGLMSDGQLLALAESHGLGAVADRLRRVEWLEDPEGLRYPRFKQSDDATAVLVRIR